MEKVFKIKAHSDNLELLQNLVRELDLDIGCTGGITVEKERFSVDIYASEKEATILEKKIVEKGLSKKIILDITDITDYLSDRLKEVGTGDRYKEDKEAKVIPRGLGTKVKQ